MSKLYSLTRVSVGGVKKFPFPVTFEELVHEQYGLAAISGGFITLDDFNFLQAKAFLLYMCERFSFPVEFVSQSMLTERRKEEEYLMEHNRNQFNWERMIKYNVQNCTSWLSNYAIQWKGQYR